MRTSGRVGQPLSLSLGDHVCWTIAPGEAAVRLLGDFFEEGLAAGEKISYLGDTIEPDAVGRELARRGLAVDELTATGRLTLMRGEDFYRRAIAGGPEGLARLYRRFSEQAVAEGYSGLRAAGDATTLVAEDAAGAALGFEVAIERVVASSPFVSVCLYDEHRCPADVIRDVSAAHPAHAGDRSSGPLFWTSAAADDRLEVWGEVDFGSAESFERVLRTAADVYGDLTLDLSGLRFLGVAGMRVLERVGKALAERDKSLTVMSVRPALRRCLELLELERLSNVRIV